MQITKVTYTEQCELPNYDELIDLGVIYRTNYNTKEVSSDTVRQAHEEFEGSDIDFDNLMVENFGSDVVSALMSDEIDLIMVI